MGPTLVMSQIKMLCAFSFLWFLLLCRGGPLDEINSIHPMGIYINGVFMEMNHSRIATWKWQDGMVRRVSVLKNQSFPDYMFKCGSVVAQGNRFWLLGGEGTVNNLKYQSVDTVLTGTVDSTGKVAHLKQVRSLPHRVSHGRALIHDNRIWHLGGYRHSELVVAEMLPDGELGEWTHAKHYPFAIADGGFVLYQGCFYANGKARWTRGTDRMYALRITPTGLDRKWRRVEAPIHAMGDLHVHEGALYFFDELSGNIYKSLREPDDPIQITEWSVAGKMPSPPLTKGVRVLKFPQGWAFFGGGLMDEQERFKGFFKGHIMPYGELK